MPIRYATIEVRIPNQNGRKALLATGATDANGNFSIFVRDSKVRTVMVRALTSSDEIAGMFVQVQSWFTPQPIYAVASPDVPNHNPDQDLDFGNIEDIRELRKLYPDEKIGQVVRSRRGLSPRAGKYWAVKLGIPLSEVSCLKTYYPKEP